MLSRGFLLEETTANGGDCLSTIALLYYNFEKLLPLTYDYFYNYNRERAEKNPLFL